MIWSLFLIATLPLTFRWLNNRLLDRTYFNFWYNFRLFSRPHWVLAGDLWMVHCRVLRIYVSFFLSFIRLARLFLLLLLLCLLWWLSLFWYHRRLTWWWLERSYILRRRSGSSLGCDYWLSGFINILSTLILVHLGFLMKSSNIFPRCNDLLTATQVFDISTTLGRLLALLLLARIMIVLLWYRVLLRILLNSHVAMRVMETSLRLHRVVCPVGLRWHQSHIVSTRAGCLSRILTTVERLICRTTCCTTRDVSTRSVVCKALMIAPIHVLFALRCIHTRHLHRLKLFVRGLLVLLSMTLVNGSIYFG